MGKFTAHESERLIMLAGIRCRGVGVMQTSLRGSARASRSWPILPWREGWLLTWYWWHMAWLFCHMLPRRKFPLEREGLARIWYFWCWRTWCCAGIRRTGPGALCLAPKQTESSLTFLSLGAGLEFQHLKNLKGVNNLLKVKCVLKSFVAYESQKAGEVTMTETWLRALAARNQSIPNLSVLKHAWEIQGIKKIPLLVITGYSLWMLLFFVCSEWFMTNTRPFMTRWPEVIIGIAACNASVGPSHSLSGLKCTSTFVAVTQVWVIFRNLALTLHSAPPS